MSPFVTSIKRWRPARKFPATYPGDCPSDSYLLVGDYVHHMRVDGTGRILVYDDDGGERDLDDVLAGNGAARVADRYRVLAYGANRNPATLHVKMQNYDYKPTGRVTVLPALHGAMRSADVVACGLHGQGYLYGDLLLDSPATVGTEVETWILLLDQDQLRVLNDSKALRSGLYSVGVLDDVRVLNTAAQVPALTYFANAPILLSPASGTPLAFSSVRATGRSIASMTPLQMLAHLLDAYGLAQEVSGVTGIENDRALEESGLACPLGSVEPSSSP